MTSKTKLKKIYKELGILREELAEEILVSLNFSMSNDYTCDITEKIVDDVAEDIWETADHDEWNDSDLSLAIGRVICDKLGISH